MPKRSPEKMTELPLVTDDMFESPTQSKEIENLLNEANDLLPKIARLKDIRTRITELSQGYGGFRTETQAAIVSFVGGRRTLDKKKLVENGVSPEIIEQSTTLSKDYWKCELVPLNYTLSGDDSE